MKSKTMRKMAIYFHRIIRVLFMMKYLVAHFEGEIGIGIGVTHGIGCFYL